eukprot:gene12412-12547_t
MEYVESCGRKVEDFVRSSTQFQESCDNAFHAADALGQGRVPVSQVAAAAVVFFKDSGYKEDDAINRKQFEEVYVAILKYAAVKCAAGFAQKYGVGMAMGFTAVVVLKRAIRSVPVIGALSKPLLGLFPAPIFGPILGVLAVFIADRGDLTDVRRKLFPDSKGQFKSG